MESRYQVQCGLFGCGKMIDVSEKEWKKKIVDFCPHCNNPLWPLDKGFTGNDPEMVRAFAATHNYDGSLK